MFVLPRTTAPSAFSFSITVALYGGLKPLSIFDAQVVSSPSTQMLSFTATGIPLSLPDGAPDAARGLSILT